MQYLGRGFDLRDRAADVCLFDEDRASLVAELGGAGKDACAADAGWRLYGPGDEQQ